MRESRLRKIVQKLSQQCDPDWFAKNNKRDPYRILISCLLSLRTKDEVTFPATERLFSLARTPQKMVTLKERDIAKVIYPVGFYNIKAKRILEISTTLIDRFNSQVPDDIDTLLTLRGVGRKTANLVVSVGYGKPGLCVDTHVHRISNRLGIVKTKTPNETEFALRKVLPQKYWISFNNLLVRHGQKVCRPISPFCSICIIERYCQRVGLEKFR